MGNESAKKTRNKSAKNLLSESAMISKQNKNTALCKCGIFRQSEYIISTYSMPRMTKRKVDELLDWHLGQRNQRCSGAKESQGH
mmetsp:Transcript_30716/g.48138  ORF Transcript_30716/g.48138 Transcript_30716/m.48138 type:complete len:84 (-) Transcript_30716:937-1188(-)